jgi:hypothetical protein
VDEATINEAPKVVIIAHDITYFIPGQYPGVEITRQFYANQRIDDPTVISELIERGAIFSSEIK